MKNKKNIKTIKFFFFFINSSNFHRSLKHGPHLHPAPQPPFPRGENRFGAGLCVYGTYLYIRGSVERKRSPPRIQYDSRVKGGKKGDVLEIRALRWGKTPPAREALLRPRPPFAAYPTLPPCSSPETLVSEPTSQPVVSRSTQKNKKTNNPHSMVLNAKLLAHVDTAVLDALTALEVVVADDNGALGVVAPAAAAPTAAFAAADIDLVGRQHVRAAGKWIHVRGFVGPVRGRVARVRVGVLLALRDVAVRLAALARPVREQRGEERPHERDAGARAPDARLEHGPEEGRRD